MLAYQGILQMHFALPDMNAIFLQHLPIQHDSLRDILVNQAINVVKMGQKFQILDS